MENKEIQSENIWNEDKRDGVKQFILDNMENKILTAKEFFNEELSGEPLTEESIIEAMIEFAKLHCEAQLKAILENAKTKTKMIPYTGVRAGGSFPMEVVDKDSILNAYPLENIK